MTEELREITLEKDHKQGDVQHYAGQTVFLPKDVVEWLTGVKIEEKVKSRTVIEEVKPAEDAAD